MNKEEIIQRLDNMVGRWAANIRYEEEKLAAVTVSERRAYQIGYIIGKLQSKWELEDEIDRIEEGEECE